MKDCWVDRFGEFFFWKPAGFIFTAFEKLFTPAPAKGWAV